MRWGGSISISRGIFKPQTGAAATAGVSNTQDTAAGVANTQAAAAGVANTQAAAAGVTTIQAAAAVTRVPNTQEATAAGHYG